MNRVVSQLLSFSLIALAGVGIGWGGVTLIGRVNAGASVRKGDYSSVLATDLIEQRWMRWDRRSWVSATTA